MRVLAQLGYWIETFSPPSFFHSFVMLAAISIASTHQLSLIRLFSSHLCHLYYRPLDLHSPTESRNCARNIARHPYVSNLFDTIRSGHSNSSHYGTCSAKSSHSISLLVSSYILVGRRVQKRLGVRGGRPYRMLERWGWIMVDGTIA